MPDATLVEPKSEFVWRRLVDPVSVPGFKEPLDGHWWLALLIPLLGLALVYVIWMYIRDGRSIGWFFGSFLALLRVSVYAILTVLFLMPAMQVLDESITRFKVIVMFDVSGSMGNKDDVPTDSMPADKILSRQDKVLRFLSDEQLGFLKKLNRNPVALYRFGAALDAAAQNYDESAEPASPAELKAFLYPDLKPPVISPDATPDEKDAARKKYDLHLMLVNGTNVPESVLSVLKRESSTQPQGLVLVSDGRSTGFSTQAVEEVRKSKVPVFTVGVGEYRQQVRIAIEDVAVPQMIQPDMPFPVRVDVDGEGLADQEVTITLKVYKPVPGEKDDDEIKEEPKRKPDMELTQKVKFRAGDPPHAFAEFPFDPAKMPAEFRKADSAKPELLDGKWVFIATVPKDKREIFTGKEHGTRPSYMRVLKRPLRVLLFAGGPTRDYQFARTLLVRETESKRAELSIHVQNARPEVVQDVPEERMLREFPSKLTDPNDPNEKADEKYLNLLQYDVILAFDPDWTKVTEKSVDAMNNLEKWVDKHRGGLIVVGGPVNTFQLTRGLNTEKVKPLLDMLPVVLDDNRIYSLDRSTAEPWRLNFPGATAEMEFLKLDEEAMDQRDVLAGWEEFFTGRTKADGRDVPLKRGFFDFYPVREVKTNATVIATFTDPRARMKDGKEQPYYVAMPYGGGQHNVIWVGSGEIWRLRQFKEAFHERFLIKLMRYAGAGAQSGGKLRGDIQPLTNASANRPFRVRARMDGKDMNPLAQTEKPQVIIKALGVENAKPVLVDLKAEPVAAGDKWNGYFAGPTQLPAGTYSAELTIPGTNDKLYQKYVIPETNLEMDNPRPDFIELRRLASNAKDVLERVPEELRKPLEADLERTNRAYMKEGDRDLRLFFDLKSANAIPECMTRKPLPQISRGPVKDLWDEGFAWFGLPKVSLALMVLVGLFSVEWLTRKLLKLA